MPLMFLGRSPMMLTSRTVGQSHPPTPAGAAGTTHSAPNHPPNQMNFPRSSGILLHPTSLPGPFGIGDLGPAAYAFADFLVQ